MTAPDLKPCPFCGSKEYAEIALADDTTCAYVECLDCEARVVGYSNRRDGITGRDAAAKAWNTRYKPKAEELFDQQVAEYVTRGKP